MKDTKIEWTDATWNPIRGCSRVSEGCRNCYAEGVANRFKGPGMPYEGLIARGGQWNGQIKFVPEKLTEPLRWQKPRKIFVNSMSDLFHENVSDYEIDCIFGVMAAADHHIFQVLTKRPERMRDYLSRDRRKDWASAAVNYWGANDPDCFHDSIHFGHEVLPNVWLGVSVEDQKTADERIPLLLDTPAAVRWISAEPLLGLVNLEQCAPYIIGGDESNPGVLNAFNGVCHHPKTCMFEPDKQGTADGIQWVVVGGESGPNARPMHPDWPRLLRDQCYSAGVAFLFKQWGEWVPGDMPAWPENADLAIENGKGYCFEAGQWMDRVGKKAAGRHLDDELHDGYPGGAA